MRTFRLKLGVLAVAGIGMGACSSEPDPAPTDEVRPVAVRQPDATAFPSAVVDELEARFPVLGREPAPEPRPGAEADPREIPEGLRGAVSERVLQAAMGGATFYADRFEGRRTASGIPFRQNQMVAAHRSFPFGTLLRVTNLNNDRSVNVRVVDRGPFGSEGSKRRTIIDLSRRAASRLGFVGQGRAQVRVEVLEWGEGLPSMS